MSQTSQAFLASIAAAAIAVGQAVHASSAVAMVGWGLSGWCCISAAAGACFLRGLDE